MDRLSSESNHGLDIKSSQNGLNLYKSINGVKDKLVILLWARSKPKIDIFNEYIAFSKSLGKPISFWVDDITPLHLYNRTQEEQAIFNNEYEDYLSAQGIEYKIIIKEFEKFLDNKTFFESLKSISITDLNLLLPQKKRQDLMNLKLNELVHTVTQLKLIETLAQEDTTFVIGKFSSGIYYYFNNKFKKISFIIFDKMKNVHSNFGKE